MVLVGVAVLLLTIPSTRNHLYIVYGANVMLVISGLPLTTPSIRNCFSYSTASTRQVYIGWCWPPSDYSIQQESSLSPPWNLKLGKDHVWCHWRPSVFSSNRNNQHFFNDVLNRPMITLGVVGLLLTIPSTRNFSPLHGILNKDITDSPMTFPSSRNLLLHSYGHFSFLHSADSFYVTAGRWSPTSQPSSLVYFHFVKILSNHICRLLWYCHFWRKRSHLLINTKPPLIPGINHYCLWSLAPASTMVRLRLERVATESSCTIELDMYNDGWLVSMLFNKFYRFIQNFQISSDWNILGSASNILLHYKYVNSE